MCPPAKPLPLSEIGPYWNDEQIVTLLNEYTAESHLPSDVLQDSNPYSCPPSNLPEGIWYLVRSNEKKESVHGFWKTKGEPCKIYSNSIITGWRTTLEFFEGQAPHGQRTDWLMQEFRVTQQELRDKDKTKDSRLLCRVFLCSGHSSKSEVLPDKNPDSYPQAHLNRIVGDYLELDDLEDRELNSFSWQNSSCPSKLSDDYLELDDLEDRESNSSSSQNSSCPSKLSHEYFNPSALLRQLKGEENEYIQGNQSNSRYVFTPSVRSNDMVLQPASSGSLGGAGRIESVEGSQTGSTIHESSTVKRVQEHTAKRHDSDSSTEGTSKSCDVEAPSSSRKNTVRSGERKPGSSRMKKLKTYFCFATF